MDFKAMMAAAAARNQARVEAIARTLEPATPKVAKPRIRVRAGEIVTELMLKLALGIETAAQKLERWAESKREAHREGGACPHCSGTGRYRFHTQPGRNDKCYRCHGKGRLDRRDLAFLDRRIKGAGPICWVVSAPAA